MFNNSPFPVINSMSEGKYTPRFKESLMFNPKENLLDKQLTESGIELKGFTDLVADVFTGGAHSRNKQAKKQAKEQNKAEEAAYKFEGEELQRSYEYSKESLEIQKRNTEANISFQEKQLKQQYDYGMGIRATNIIKSFVLMTKVFLNSHSKQASTLQLKSLLYNNKIVIF